MVNSRRKGHDFERRIAARFREVFGINMHRGQQGDGARECDVEGHPWFHIECKRSRSVPSVYAAMEQAKRDLGDDTRYPVVVFQRDRSKPMVCMELDDWLEIMLAHWVEAK